MSDKPVWMETWTTDGWCGPDEEGVWPWQSVRVRAPLTRQPTGMIAHREDLGDTEGREKLSAAAPQLVRALLLAEWHDGYKYECGADCRVHHEHEGGNGHAADCPLDAALTAAGFPHQAGRDAARKMMGE